MNSNYPLSLSLCLSLSHTHSLTEALEYGVNISPRLLGLCAVTEHLLDAVVVTEEHTEVQGTLSQ